ncbi:MAG: hypothetical protein AAFP77_25475 [Bacteroidota bacterium]
MKEQQYPWEADLRRQVEQHEFDYDPGGWAAMEEILDGGSVPVSTEAVATLHSSWLKWTLLALLGTALIILLLLRSPQKEQSENLQIPGTEQPSGQEELPQDVPVPAISAVKEAEPEDHQSFVRPSRKIEVLAPLPPPSFKEVKPLPARSDAYQTSPLPTIEWTLLSDSLRTQDVLPEPQLPRRKRNRKKLFPDVLDQQ